jgi:hypothetical protein
MNRAPVKGPHESNTFMGPTSDGIERHAPLGPLAGFAVSRAAPDRQRARSAARVRPQRQPQFLQVQGLQRQPPRAGVQAQGALVSVVMVFLLNGPGGMRRPRITL